MSKRISALGEIAVLIGPYLEANKSLIGPADSWNPAGFDAERMSTDFGWIFQQLPKPTLEQLEAIKVQLEPEYAAILEQLKLEEAQAALEAQQAAEAQAALEAQQAPSSNEST